MPQKKGKLARTKRALKKKEPKVVEDPKSILCFRGPRTNEELTQVLKDLAMLKKPYSRMFQRRNDIRPFNDGESIEFLCDKNDCSLFATCSHSKKRPNNLTFGRLFDGRILDMMEFEVEGYGSLADFKTAKPPIGSRPCFVFSGDKFEHDENFRRAKNLLMDMFRGEQLEAVALPGLHWVMACTAGETLLHIRCYTVELRNSGVKVPRVELVPMGFFLDLRFRRVQAADPARERKALKKPKELEPGKTKNVQLDSLGEKVGRVHMERQDLSKLELRKMKGLKVHRGTKRTREEADGEEPGDEEAGEESRGEAEVEPTPKKGRKA